MSVKDRISEFHRRLSGSSLGGGGGDASAAPSARGRSSLGGASEGAEASEGGGHATAPPGTAATLPSAVAAAAAEHVSGSLLERRVSGVASAAGGATPIEVPVSVIVRCRPAANREVPCLHVSSSSSTAPNGADQATVVLEPAASEEPSAIARPTRGIPSGGRAGPRSFKCNAFLDEHAEQQDVFAHAASVVDRVMEGYNGTIFCYGITGSGKTHTMTGPPQDGRRAAPTPTPMPDDGDGSPGSAEEQQMGIAQRAARRLFEFVRDRAEFGEVFSVEASFLEICPSDGSRELLVDLLSEADERPGPGASVTGAAPRLEVRQDPLNPRAFSCEGLTKVPIASPWELCEVLEAGRRRCHVLETTRNRLSSRSHCLFIVTVERMAAADRAADLAAAGAEGPTPGSSSSSGPPLPRVRRGKLVLVDLAGSESLKKVMAADDANEDVRRKQAIGINRVLTHLGAVVNNLNAGFDSSSAGFRSSALTMLLKDCLGGRARALLIATMSPEAEWASETYTTLTFAQQMMQVRNAERATFVEGSKSTLVQMQQRHLQCLQRLREQQAAGADNASSSAPVEEYERLQGEVADLNRRLLTKVSATEALEQMQLDRRKKIDELREEMSQAMSREFSALQEQANKDLEGLKNVVTEKLKESMEMAARRRQEQCQAETGALQGGLNASVQARQGAETEAEKLKARIASVEEEAEQLEALHADVSRERAALDMERQEMRCKEEEQHANIAVFEGEKEKLKAEAAFHTQQIELLRARIAADADAATSERKTWAVRQADLEAEAKSTREQLEARLALTSSTAAEAASRRAAELDSLRTEVSRLQADSAAKEEEVQRMRRAEADLEDEMQYAAASLAEWRADMEEDLQRIEEETQVSRQSADEILAMLSEVQGSVAVMQSRRSSAAPSAVPSPRGATAQASLHRALSS